MQTSYLGVKARPGKVVYGSFAVMDVPIPLIVVAGRRPGKTLVIHCAQHATEYSGSAMIGPLLAELNPATLRGTLVIVPLSNLPHIARLRLPQLYQPIADSNKPYETTAQLNINRCWPGKQAGTFNDRLTWTLTHELFAHADAVLDYHSCRMCDPDFTQYVKGEHASRDLALAFGFATIDETKPEGHFPGQLHFEVPKTVGVPAILVEMSPTSERVLWSAVGEAKRGALNTLKHLGMIGGKPELPPVQVVYHRGSNGVCLRATQIGFGVTYKQPGVAVRKGELIAEVRSLQDFSVLERHVAPFAGGVGSCGPANHHVVLPGEELATVQKGVEIIRNR